MRPTFPLLASIAALLAVAIPFEPRARVAAALATMATHGLAAVWLGLGRRSIEATAPRLGLPEWVGAQGEKGFRKGAVPGAAGALLAAIVFVIGPGAGWRSGLWAANLAFQVGAFVGEYGAIVAQARLGRALAGWPGGLSGP